MSVREKFWDITDELMGQGHKGSCFDLWRLGFIKCMDDGNYDLAISYLHAEYDGASGDDHNFFIHLVSDRLIKEHKVRELKRLWRSAIRIQQSRHSFFLEHYRECKFDFRAEEKVAHLKYVDWADEVVRKKRISNGDMPPAIYQYIDMKSEVLKTLSNYDKLLSTIGGEEDEQARILEIRSLVEAGKKPKAKKATDKRKMDDQTFWAVIEEAEQSADNPDEVPEKLREKLEFMTATAIKKFDKQFRQLVGSLYHWDLWALAYIMNGGCGDDAFEYFCAGLVLQGKETVYLAQNDLNALGKKLELSSTDISCEEALCVAENAYGNKTGNPLPYQNINYPDIKGEKWEEDDLPERYPELCEIFGWNNK